MTKSRYLVRQADERDLPAIIELCRAVYDGPAWTEEQLRSHQKVFAPGQLVVVDRGSGVIVGFAASLIVRWDDYDPAAPWRDFTDFGFFTNHDPANGRTLYGAEIMVNPSYQGKGAGSHLYRAREELTRKLGLLRIRAGARLRGYSRYAAKMSAEDYVRSVVRKKVSDPTLSFQLRRGFHVLSVIPGYLRHDPESMSFAALIEWINPEVAKEEDYRFIRSSPFRPLE